MAPANRILPACGSRLSSLRQRISRHRRKLGFVPFTAVIAATAATSVAHAEPTRLTTGLSNNKYYEVYRNDSVLTWSEAKAFAKSFDSNLVSIGSRSENAYVSSLIQDTSLWTDTNTPAGNYVGPYVGLSKAPGSSDPRAGWRWEDGSQPTTNLWFFNQPDGYNGDNVGLFYNGYSQAKSNSTWGDVFDGRTITQGPYSPGPNPFLANSFVVESPFPLAAISQVASGTYNNQDYQVYKSTGLLTWSQAQAYANQILGSSLVSIHSQEENMFISSLITDPSLWANTGDPSGTKIGPYIGLYQVPGSPEPAGGWVWEDGTSSTGYTNWFFNQPDNYNGDNVGAFYNGFDMASADTPWGDIYDGLTILTGPGSPGPNPFLANSFVVSSPAATPFMTSMVMSRFMMADTSSDLPADFLPSLTFQSQPEVPGPLPVIGGLLAYHRSRQLRARMGRLRSTTSR